MKKYRFDIVGKTSNLLSFYALIGIVTTHLKWKEWTGTSDWRTLWIDAEEADYHALDAISIDCKACGLRVEVR